MKMGKIYLNINAGSNSIDYDSPRFLGFAKEKKGYSHKQARNNNWLKIEINMNTVTKII